MKKITLGTSFSGIGAIEFALKRLGIETDILFAIDNGDIEIEVDYERELKKIRSFTSIDEKRTYVKELYDEKSKKHNFVEESYKANYKVVNDNYFYDVKLFDGTDFKDKIDLYVGGSPCQSFSIAGARGGFEDTRGTLFYEYCRLVKEIEPKVFIYENVYGVLTHDHGRTWDTMKNTFSELGYYYKWQILDAKDYNIPQGRRRIFVVGFKNKKICEEFNFPEKKELKFTMQDFLLTNCGEGNFTFNKNGEIDIKPIGQNVERYLSQKLVDYVMSPGTKNFYHEDSKIDLPIARAILSTQGNTHRASVNNYVTKSDGHIRALEPRESLRLMGFTDEFKIVVSRAQSYKQSGNSIVVDVLMNLVKEISKVFDMEERDKTSAYRVVSLFAGIGGMDLGFINNGFNVVWANDLDKYACETYKVNISKNIVCGDIRIEKENIPEHDVLIGGFPCQPFSTLGKLKGFEDKERGTLFFEIKDILKRYKTKVVVLENVKNIMNHDKGKTFQRIIHELESLGFVCFYHIFNSADYGVPQRRNRCYIVAFRGEYFNTPDFEFPAKQKLTVTTQDLLDEDVEEKYFLTKRIVGTIMGRGTKNYIVNPTIDLPISKTLTATMAKMHRASQDNYVTDQKNYEKYCGDDRVNIRRLTPNECRKLQGFPDSWRQVVSDSQAYKQFGNAVTVNVSNSLALALKQYMDKNKKDNW